MEQGKIEYGHTDLKVGKNGNISNIYHTIINRIAFLYSCIDGYMLKGNLI